MTIPLIVSPHTFMAQWVSVISSVLITSYESPWHPWFFPCDTHVHSFTHLLIHLCTRVSVQTEHWTGKTAPPPLRALLQNTQYLGTVSTFPKAFAYSAGWIFNLYFWNKWGFTFPFSFIEQQVELHQPKSSLQLSIFHIHLQHIAFQDLFSWMFSFTNWRWF